MRSPRSTYRSHASSRRPSSIQRTQAGRPLQSGLGIGNTLRALQGVPQASIPRHLVRIRLQCNHALFLPCPFMAMREFVCRFWRHSNSNTVCKRLSSANPKLALGCGISRVLSILCMRACSRSRVPAGSRSSAHGTPHMCALAIAMSDLHRAWHPTLHARRHAVQIGRADLHRAWSHVLASLRPGDSGYRERYDAWRARMFTCARV
jgi:hypothetical protein